MTSRVSGALRADVIGIEREGRRPYLLLSCGHRKLQNVSAKEPRNCYCFEPHE